MATPQDVLAQLEAIIERHYGAGAGAAKEALARAAGLVAVYMGGREEWLFSDLDELTAALERAMSESGLDSVLAEFVKASEEMARAAQTIPQVTFGAVEGARLQSALQARFTGWDKTVNDEAIGWLRDRMLSQSVAPVSPTQLAEELRVVLTEKILGYADTYIDQALSDQARATWLVTGEKLEAERYTYMGAPVDKVMRPFCREHYMKTYTRAEIDAMDNGQGLSVWESGGGWRCRHQWVPVV